MFTDDDRRTLLEALETTIGRRAAEILMGHLPPVGWVDLATRADITELRADVHGEIVELRTEMRGQIAELRAEVHGEIVELRGEMKLQFAKLVMANVVSMFAAAGLVLAAASLAG